MIYFIDKPNSLKVLICETYGNAEALGSFKFLKIEKKFHSIEEILEFKNENVYLNPFVFTDKYYHFIIQCCPRHFEEYYNHMIHAHSIRRFQSIFRVNFNPEGIMHQRQYALISKQIGEQFKIK